MHGLFGEVESSKEHFWFLHIHYFFIVLIVKYHKRHCHDLFLFFTSKRTVLLLSTS